VRTAPGKVVWLGDNIEAGCLRHTDDAFGWRRNVKSRLRIPIERGRLVIHYIRQ
jgi:hypothetical protein